MKFKLNNSEMMALIMLLGNSIIAMKGVLEKTPATSLQQTKARAATILMRAAFEELHIAMQQKALLRKDAYNVKLTPSVAVIFWLFFNDEKYTTSHAGNMVHTMCNAIHQQILSK
jgi:hypothetical protein